MFAIAASTIAVMACQGCTTATSGSEFDAGVSTPAAPSEGIQLAAPAPLGVPTLPGNDIPVLPEMDTSAIPQSTTLFTATVPTATADIEDAAIRLSLMANTAEAVLPAAEWSKSEAVELIAARQQAELLLAPGSQDEDKDFSAEFQLDAPSEVTGLAFDLGVVPRLAYREDGELKTRSFGGEVRIGQNFDKRGSDEAPNSWYIFAGADGEALTYEPGETGLTQFDAGNMALRDQVTVGDMQAGISVQRGDGQLSLSYIRREVSYSERGLQGVTENEDFAGVSFTLRK
jgi:hypothetical protein